MNFVAFSWQVKGVAPRIEAGDPSIFIPRLRPGLRVWVDALLDHLLLTQLPAAVGLRRRSLFGWPTRAAGNRPIPPETEAVQFLIRSDLAWVGRVSALDPLLGGHASELIAERLLDLGWLQHDLEEPLPFLAEPTSMMVTSCGPELVADLDPRLRDDLLSSTHGELAAYAATLTPLSQVDTLCPTYEILIPFEAVSGIKYPAEDQ